MARLKVHGLKCGKRAEREAVQMLGRLARCGRQRAHGWVRPAVVVVASPAPQHLLVMRKAIEHLFVLTFKAGAAEHLDQPDCDTNLPCSDRKLTM